MCSNCHERNVWRYGKIVSSIIWIIILVFSGFFIIDLNKDAKVKNVILLIGDGMGPSYTTAYHNILNDSEKLEVNKTIFDKHLIGMATTYLDDLVGNIRDSTTN